MNIRESAARLRRVNWRRHITDATVLSSVQNVVLAPIETLVLDMTNEVSIKSRLIGTALTFFGMTYVYVGLRDRSRRLFHIGKGTSELVYGVHDALYTAVYLGTITPPCYLLSGETDLEKIALATVGTIVGSLSLGGPVNYLMDVAEELVGVKEPERSPQWVRDLSLKAKRRVAAAGVAVPTIATIAFYMFK